MNVIVQPWARYADFRGRSTRTEFWLFHIVFWIAFIVLGLIPIIATVYGMGGPAVILWLLPCLFLTLAAIIPGLAVGIRRLHDSGQPGWLYALVVVLTIVLPFIGLIGVVVVGFLPGIKGENPYGEDPREKSGMGDRDANRIFG